MSSLGPMPAKSPGGNSANVLPPTHTPTSALETQGRKNFRALRADSPNRITNATHLYQHVSSPRTFYAAILFLPHHSPCPWGSLSLFSQTRLIVFSWVVEEPGLKPRRLSSKSLLIPLGLNLQMGLCGRRLELIVLDCDYVSLSVLRAGLESH